MIIPYGIHDVHGTMNWLWSQPTLIPRIPHGIPHGFHRDYTGEGKDLSQGAMENAHQAVLKLPQKHSLADTLMEIQQYSTLTQTSSPLIFFLQ